jgi:hypothetical protein
MTTIVEKIELGEDNNLQTTSIGYTENIHLINEINEQYDESLGAFIGGNKTKLENGVVSINTFFAAINHVHEARMTVETIENLNLTEIIHINQL